METHAWIIISGGILSLLSIIGYMYKGFREVADKQDLKELKDDMDNNFKVVHERIDRKEAESNNTAREIRDQLSKNNALTNRMAGKLFDGKVDTI